MTVEQPTKPSAPADAEALTATILTAVERQLTRYFTAMSQQADAARKLAEDARTDLTARLDAIDGVVASQREANESYQQALQVALEERLAEFANHQHWRVSDLEDKIENLPKGLDAESMMEVRQTVRDDMERSFNGINARLDDMVNTDRRFEEQASALVQHVNDTTAALALRMDEGDQRTTHAVEERLSDLQAELQATFAGIETQVVEHGNTLLSKLDAVEARGVDRLLELETRINEEQGTKIANLDATIGRIGSGFDDAMIALNQRLLELENKLLDFDERLGEMAERVAKVDENALEGVKAEMSHAVGEAMLVRIELDRVVAATDEKIDKQTIRMAEIEGLLADQMDVSTAVQLERLEELERQMQYLDPNQFVRRDSAAGSDAAGAPVSGPPTGPTRAVPSMALNPKLPGADITPAVETEPTYSAH